MELGDVPPEILFDIALSCRLRDVQALGATCRMMHALACDDRLWRALFARDFGRLYATKTTAMVLPLDVVGYDDKWSDFALEVCAGHVSVDTLPPRASTDGHTPTPFAHMAAMGKDWRWLCIAHARGASSHGWTPVLRPLPLRACDRKVSSLDGAVYVGDEIAGKRHGYGVQMRLHDGTVVEWVAGLWVDDTVCGWCVWSDVHTYRAGSALDGAWSGLAFNMARYNRKCTWGATGTYGISMREPRAVLDASGVRRAYVASTDGGSVIERLWDTNGSVSEIACNRLSTRHGRGTTRFSNGDIVVHEWAHGVLTRIAEFTCSPACPVPEFAGRRLGVDRHWTLTQISIHDEWHDYAYWIDDDDGSDDDRLFWRYVTEGFVGWAEEVRTHALRSRPRGDGGADRAVAH